MQLLRFFPEFYKQLTNIFLGMIYILASRYDAKFKVHLFNERICFDIKLNAY